MHPHRSSWLLAGCLLLAVPAFGQSWSLDRVTPTRGAAGDVVAIAFRATAPREVEVDFAGTQALSTLHGSGDQRFVLAVVPSGVRSGSLRLSVDGQRRRVAWFSVSGSAAAAPGWTAPRVVSMRPLLGEPGDPVTLELEGGPGPVRVDFGGTPAVATAAGQGRSLVVTTTVPWGAQSSQVSVELGGARLSAGVFQVIGSPLPPAPNPTPGPTPLPPAPNPTPGPTPLPPAPNPTPGPNPLPPAPNPTPGSVAVLGMSPSAGPVDTIVAVVLRTSGGPITLDFDGVPAVTRVYGMNGQVSAIARVPAGASSGTLYVTADGVRVPAGYFVVQ
ncbi:MAG: hypothetical protein R3F62_11755 [Planctomycetota bacterium]